MPRRTERRLGRGIGEINAEREAIISEYLDSSEGRQALAQSMVEPIRRAWDYQGAGRSLLMVDELPEGGLARYEEARVRDIRKSRRLERIAIRKLNRERKNKYKLMSKIEELRRKIKDPISYLEI